MLVQANLLVDADGTMRLADMGGVQKDIVAGKRQAAQRPCTFTPTYCPPEFLRGKHAAPDRQHTSAV